MSGPFGQVVGGPAGICQIVWYHNKYIHHKTRLTLLYWIRYGKQSNNKILNTIAIAPLTGKAYTEQANSYSMLKHNNNKNTADIKNTAH